MRTLLVENMDNDDSLQVLDLPGLATLRELHELACYHQLSCVSTLLDWVRVTWDADLQFTGDHRSHHAFRDDCWYKISSPDNRTFLLNAYRVLLTRARQGIVIFVPPGDPEDATRSPAS